MTSSEAPQGCLGAARRQKNDFEPPKGSFFNPCYTSFSWIRRACENVCRSVREKRLYQTNTEKHMVLHLKQVLRKNTFRQEQVRKRCIQRLAEQNARLGQSSRNIGPSWSGLGPSWDCLGRSWGPFEAYLNRSCSVFGLSWRRLGRSCEPKHDVAGKTIWRSRANHAEISATQTGSRGKTIFLRRQRIRFSLSSFRVCFSSRFQSGVLLVRTGVHLRSGSRTDIRTQVRNHACT